MNEEQMDTASVLKNIAQNVERPSLPLTILTGHGDIQTSPQGSSDQSPSLEGQKKRIIANSYKLKSRQSVLEDPYTQNDDDETDPACIYCNELLSHSRPKQIWVQYQLYSRWCHTIMRG
ncbi:hypothetical protein ILUMI_20875 [Ignelater luminosus]|uniref:Uncharacterized protein n=1 Tax=Ignelater luminosus TaxID=2038154 RepID=A0A8K0CHF0_IGNLU|nr:hypothetical protein ILUMI_20875 [Ignelater luminosus]